MPGHLGGVQLHLRGGGHQDTHLRVARGVEEGCHRVGGARRAAEILPRGHALAGVQGVHCVWAAVCGDGESAHHGGAVSEGVSGRGGRHGHGAGVFERWVRDGVRRPARSVGGGEQGARCEQVLRFGPSRRRPRRSAQRLPVHGPVQGELRGAGGEANPGGAEIRLPEAADLPRRASRMPPNAAHVAHRHAVVPHRFHLGRDPHVHRHHAADVVGAAAGSDVGRHGACARDSTHMPYSEQEARCAIRLLAPHAPRPDFPLHRRASEGDRRDVQY